MKKSGASQGQSASELISKESPNSGTGAGIKEADPDVVVPVDSLRQPTVFTD
jgi:hypothetical protein